MDNQATWEQIYSMREFAKLRKDILLDLKTNIDEVNIFLKKHPRDTILKALINPTTPAAQELLRDMSRFYYAVSTHYRRAVIMLATMPTNNYIIRPVCDPRKIDKNYFRDIYYQYAIQCKKYKFKDINPQLMLKTLVDGVFYGLMIESNNSFFIKPVLHDYCKIAMVENGVWRFAFDLNYFSTKKTLSQLSSYGKEFVKAYEMYKGNPEKKIKGDKTLRWFIPKNQICLKFDEEFKWIIPPLAGCFRAIIDLDTYMELQKDGAILDNYKLINYTVETDSDGNPSLPFEQVQKYYNQIAGEVPEGIGVAVNPFKAQGITLKDTSNTTKDYTEDATNDLFANMGLSPLLFGLGKNPTYKVIELSLNIDAMMMMKLLRQIERVYNVKYQIEHSKKSDIPLEIYFLDQSAFNKKEVADSYKNGGIYGLPTKLCYAAACDQEPIDAITASYLENDVLDCGVEIYNRPLISSNTLSNGEVDNEGGRPVTDNPSENTVDNINANDNK